MNQFDPNKAADKMLGCLGCLGSLLAIIFELVIAKFTMNFVDSFDNV